jgi:hypothetical protein
MLLWWLPGYPAWGALTAALVTIWTLWLIWRTNAGDPTVPGHPLHLVLLGPVAVLAWHLGKIALSSEPLHPMAVAGAINMSMIFQLAVLSLGVMLTQSLLPRAAGHFGVLSVCGVAMMGGAAAAITFGRFEAARSPVVLLGFVGACVWLAPLWGVLRPDKPEQLLHPLRRRGLSLACAGVAAVGAGALTWAAPHEALLAAGVIGAVVFIAGLVFRRGRILLLAAGGGVTILTATVARLARSSLMSLEWVPDRLFGRGEEAFREVFGGDSGLAVLAGAVGFFGLLWFIAGLAACTVWLMWQARRGRRGDQRRAIIWTAATALASCAMLAPGGLFSPAVTLAVAFTWGLLPSMLGCRRRARSGAALVAALVVLMVLQGLSRRSGLFAWSAGAYGWGDQLLHWTVGFTLAMVLSWYMGVRRAWLGLLGIVLAVLGGGAGELAQNLASIRGGELGDWLAHSLGAAAAAPLYFLAIGSRWCESPDAKPKEEYHQAGYGIPPEA